MNTKTKVLLADESEEFGIPCASALRSFGFDVVVVKKEGAALPQIVGEQHPDVLIMDAFMAGLDDIGVLKKLAKLEKHAGPISIVISVRESERIGAQILAQGADF